MSLPTSSGVSPAASAAAPPPVDPPGVRAGSHGFTVRPKIGLSACQSARTGGTFVLPTTTAPARSEEHTSELQSLAYLVCRLLLEKKKNLTYSTIVITSVHHNDP